MVMGSNPADPILQVSSVGVNLYGFLFVKNGIKELWRLM